MMLDRVAMETMLEAAPQVIANATPIVPSMSFVIPRIASAEPYRKVPVVRTRNARAINASFQKAANLVAVKAVQVNAPKTPTVPKARCVTRALASAAAAQGALATLIVT